MDIQLSDAILQKLQAMAQRQHWDVNAVVEEALSSYFAQQEKKKAFITDIRRIMQEHKYLLDELAKR